MAKRKYPRERNGSGQLYEIVQLLRINGLVVERDGPRDFKLRMGHKGTWSVRHMRDTELKACYGPGTIEYDILRKHPRANTVVPDSRKHTKHMDLIA